MTVAADIISLDAHRRPTVSVKRTVCVNRPNCTRYRIHGTRNQDVQDHIESLVAELENHGINFFSSWHGPTYIGRGCYVAIGEIVLITEVV